MIHLSLPEMHNLPVGSIVAQSHCLSLSQFLIKKNSEILGPDKFGIKYRFTFMSFMKHPIKDDEGKVEKMILEMYDRQDGLEGMPECFHQPSPEELEKYHAWFTLALQNNRDGKIREAVDKSLPSAREERLDALMRFFLPHLKHKVKQYSGKTLDPIIDEQALASLVGCINEATYLLDPHTTPELSNFR
jgi:hypothetical protein